MDLDQTRRYLAESNLKVKQLTDVNASFNSDIKIQKRIYSKYKSELDISETKRKQTDSDLVDLKKRNEELMRNLKELTRLNEEQKSETLVAQKAIDKMNQGMSIVFQYKQRLLKII